MEETLKHFKTENPYKWWNYLEARHEFVVKNYLNEQYLKLGEAIFECELPLIFDSDFIEIIVNVIQKNCTKNYTRYLIEYEIKQMFSSPKYIEFFV